MTDKDWFELVMWGCAIGVVAFTALMGIIIARSMNRIDQKYKVKGGK